MPRAYVHHYVSGVLWGSGLLPDCCILFPMHNITLYTRSRVIDGIIDGGISHGLFCISHPTACHKQQEKFSGHRQHLNTDSTVPSLSLAQPCLRSSCLHSQPWQIVSHMPYNSARQCAPAKQQPTQSGQFAPPLLSSKALPQTFQPPASFLLRCTSLTIFWSYWPH